MRVILLAGGFGTRLGKLTKNRQKTMLPLGEEKVLERIVRSLVKEGYDEIVFSLYHRPDEVKEHFGDGSYFGVRKLWYLIDEDDYGNPTAIGNGGVLRLAYRKGILDESDLVMMHNGDIVINPNYSELENFHKKHEDAAGTILLKELENKEDLKNFGVAELDENNIIKRFVEKPNPEETPSSLVNTGVSVLNVNKVLPYLRSGFTHLERTVFPELASRGELFGYRYSGYWSDIGKPEAYEKAINDAMKGII